MRTLSRAVLTGHAGAWRSRGLHITATRPTTFMWTAEATGSRLGPELSRIRTRFGRSTSQLRPELSRPPLIPARVAEKRLFFEHLRHVWRIFAHLCQSKTDFRGIHCQSIEDFSRGNCQAPKFEKIRDWLTKSAAYDSDINRRTRVRNAAGNRCEGRGVAERPNAAVTSGR
jgi:hypothetical protein